MMDIAIIYFQNVINLDFALIQSSQHHQSPIQSKSMSFKLSWKQIVLKVESSKRNLQKNKQKHYQHNNLNPSLLVHNMLASGIQQSNQRQESIMKKDVSVNEVIQAARIQLQQQRRIVVHPLQLSSKGRIFENKHNQIENSSSTLKNHKRRAIRSLLYDSDETQKSPIFMSSFIDKKKMSSQLKNDIISHQTKERNSINRKNQSNRKRQFLSIQVEKDKIRQTDVTKTEEYEPVSSFIYEPIGRQDPKKEFKETQPKMFFDLPSQISNKLSFGIKKQHSSPINLIRRTKIPQKERINDQKLDLFGESFIDIKINGESIKAKKTNVKRQGVLKDQNMKLINPLSNLLKARGK